MQQPIKAEMSHDGGCMCMCCVSSGVCVAGNSSSRCEILELELPPRLSATQNQVTLTPHRPHNAKEDLFQNHMCVQAVLSSAPAALKILFGFPLARSQVEAKSLRHCLTMLTKQSRRVT